MSPEINPIRFAVCLLFGVLLGNAYSHPVISTTERYSDGQLDGNVIGRVLIGELNCFSCHDNASLKQVEATTKTAPILTGVGSRIQSAYFQKFVRNPHEIKPGTTMPSLFEGLPAEQAESEIAAIWYFLKSKSPEPPAVAFGRIGSKDRGQTLYESVGCLGCHDAKGDDAVAWADSIPHGDLGSKYTILSLSTFLRDPHSVRPSGRMPSLNLSSAEAMDIASYLLPNVPEESGIAVNLYKGSWQNLPNFDELTPAESKGTETIAPNLFSDRDNFGLRFEATIQIDEPGRYRFFLHSDDGSRLSIDGTTIIDHDGIHGGNEKRGRADLTAGRHSLRLDYFEAQGGEELRLEFARRDEPRAKIETIVVSSVEVELAAEERITEFDSTKVAEGAKLFQTRGCAACHQVDGIDKDSTPAYTKEFASASAGCLAENPPTSAPNYFLSAEQRKALQQVIAKKTDSTFSADQQIQHTMMTFNCLACHQRGELGGVTTDRNTSFKGTQPEMGDEGRIPPHLNGVGGKLTTAWLEQTLDNGAKDRPYMLARMPKFGKANVGHLQPLLESEDKLEPLEDIVLDSTEAKKAGRFMVGEKGFACIKCHTFGRFEATGVQSIDMTTMTRRLRVDWFRRYVRNPQEFRRGTRMPSAWPVRGKSLLPDILDADSNKQIVAVWKYLEDGPRARIPAGLVTDSMELIPEDEPLIYRNFIQGAGPRAIAVGYPETVNLALDADKMRLALIWKGAFIDAKRHWTGRGQGFEAPQGKDVVSFNESSDFAKWNEGESWPNDPLRSAAIQFKGYRLGEERRPTFLYRMGELEIEDTFVPKEGATKTTLVRSVSIRGNVATEGVHFKAAVANAIQAEADNWFALDNGMRLRVTSEPGTARLAKLGSQQAVLVPITLKDGEASIEVEFDW